MSTRSRPGKKASKKKVDGWPLVVYLWAIGLGLFGYLVIGRFALSARPHPVHWLAGLVGAAAGVGVGWLWYRYRGDVV
jgi:hypothetical protein